MTQPEVTLALETRVVRKAELPSTKVDNDVVVLNVATQNYVGLDDIGGALWELLAEPQQVADLCRIMCARYDGPPEEIAADVTAFLAELHREGLIAVVT